MIKSVAALLRDQTGKRCKGVFLCNVCKNPVFSKAAFDTHTKNCKGKPITTLPERDNSYIRYKHLYKQNPVSFIFTGDIETFQCSQSSEERTKCHTAVSIGLQKTCMFDTTKSEYFEFFGPNCITDFLETVAEQAIHIYDTCLSSKSAVDMIFTAKDLFQYNNELSCKFCGRQYSDPLSLSQEVIKVRDHDHNTGRFRSSLCSTCNLNYKIPVPFIPLWFHNGSRYDFHFLAKHFPVGSDVEVLPRTKENYIAMYWRIKLPVGIDSNTKDNFTLPTHVKIAFLDSFRFLPSSLDTLVTNLPTDCLIETRREMGSHHNIDYFLKKNIYPYEYLDSWVKYDKPLPDKSSFYSHLKGKGISDEEYHFAQKSYKYFKCKSLKDYTLVYMKLDVTLLADVVVNLIRQGLKNYNLDPCHFVSAPSYAYECALKMSQVNLKVFEIGERDKYDFIDKSVRGGISTLGSTRYMKANNKYLNENYDAEKLTKTVLYLDKNSLYGSVMLNNKLPTGDFVWQSQEILKDINYFINFPSEAKYSFFLECSFIYDKKLHNLHKELPFLAESLTPPGSNQKKLILNLYDKNKYILHLEHLKLCVKHGLVLTKIHRALKFKQSNWLHDYISFNLEKRRNATNAFDKMYFKLQINSVFGKTLQRNEDMLDVKFITDWYDSSVNKNKKKNTAQALISSPRFHSISIFNENLVAIQMEPKKIILNRPKFVGSTICELSKVQMYKFFYEVIMKHYENSPEDVKLCLTDTDSFVISIENDKDVYKNFIAPNAVKHFDTSAFNPNVFPFMPLVNKDVPGMMKIEYQDNFIKEIIALRPKLYSFIMIDLKEYCKAKGVNFSAISNIKYSDYMKCYEEKQDKILTLYQILSKLHVVVTKAVNKIALNEGDDKRYYLSSSLSLPYGHYKIKQMHNRIGSDIFPIDNE